VRGRPAIAPAKADRGRKLLSERFDLGAQSFGPVQVIGALGFLKFGPKLDQPPLVGGFCLLIEDCAGVAQVRGSRDVAERGEGD
jgi:hypothetical protein